MSSEYASAGSSDDPRFSSPVKHIPWVGGPWGQVKPETPEPEVPTLVRRVLIKDPPPVPDILEVFTANSKGGDFVQDDVWLCVGGTKFRTTRQTLCRFPQSALARVVQDSTHSWWKCDFSGCRCLFVDRDPAPFAVILAFLRTGRLSHESTIPRAELRRELQFYGIPMPPSVGAQLSAETAAATWAASGESLTDTITELIDELDKKAIIGCSYTTFCVASNPYRLVSDEQDPVPEFLSMFDHGRVDIEKTRVLAPPDAREVLMDRLADHDVFVRAGYHRGDVYGSRAPPHVWIICGTRKELLHEIQADLDRRMSRWSEGGSHH